MDLKFAAIVGACAVGGYLLTTYVMSMSDKARSDDDPLGIGSRRPRPTTPPGVEPWFQTLGVSESASLEEIKRSYRQLISQYHPDKVANMGQEIRLLAEKRSQAINVAYEQGIARTRAG
jgi:DnaJ-domain-containing protein 1